MQRCALGHPAVNVESSDDIVTLTGTASDASRKSLAQETVAKKKRPTEYAKVVDGDGE